MHLGLFVCLSVRTRNSKTVAPINLIILQIKCYPRGSGSRSGLKHLLYIYDSLPDRTKYAIIVRLDMKRAL